LIKIGKSMGVLGGDFMVLVLNWRRKIENIISVAITCALGGWGMVLVGAYHTMSWIRAVGSINEQIGVSCAFLQVNR
jgi:hypothetical protein